MLNDSPDRPAAGTEAAAVDPPPAEPPRPDLILLEADDDAVCLDDTCLPADARR